MALRRWHALSNAACVVGRSVGHHAAGNVMAWGAHGAAYCLFRARSVACGLRAAQQRPWKGAMHGRPLKVARAAGCSCVRACVKRGPRAAPHPHPHSLTRSLAHSQRLTSLLSCAELSSPYCSPAHCRPSSLSSNTSRMLVCLHDMARARAGAWAARTLSMLHTQGSGQQGSAGSAHV